MNSISPSPKFVVLAILDGWGIAPKAPGNAILLAKTPNIDLFMKTYPHTELEASGQAVGLPRNESGNTETGHLNIGAGKIVYQDLERINMSIAEGSFFKNKAFLGAISHAKNNHSNLHIMGLVGAGGVHSNIEHLFAVLQLVKKESLDRVFLHLFTDGRDTPRTSAKIYISKVEEFLSKTKAGRIASVMGRYWAMDRDHRWDRTKKAYLALTSGKCKTETSALKVINKAYVNDITDEFIEPHLIVDANDKPTLISDNDSIIFINFRIDRPRQLTKAFVFEDMNKAQFDFDFDPYQVKYEHTHNKRLFSQAKKTFDRGEKLKNICFVTMTEYGKPIKEAGAIAAFPPKLVKDTLGEIIANSGVEQLRITESEKERFVTFYFNGLRETPFEGERRIIVPSSSVATYDQKPEMEADILTNTLIDQQKKTNYKFILINYPNPDMVGHTGNIEPTMKAINAVDDVLGRLASYVLSCGGALVITADHGNAEEMINSRTNRVDTEHSSNPVPFIVISKTFKNNPVELDSGILADIAPTILSLLKIEIPKSMTGKNLLARLK